MIDTKNKQFSLILFNKFSDLLAAFTSARATSNLWSICLEVSILCPVPFGDFNGKNPLLKAMRTNSLPS